jgi:uncharacterized membrane protein
MINGYTVLLTLHILCALIWVGGGITLHVLGRMAVASGDRQRMLQFSRDADWIGPRFYAPLSVLLLVFGILLVNRDEVGADMSTLWVSLGLAGWLISFLIGILYYSRAGKKRDAIIAGEGLESAAFHAQYMQVANVNLIEITLLLLVVIDMAIKPT